MIATKFNCVAVLLYLFLMTNNLSAQKHDYVWLLGFGSVKGDTTRGGTNIDFNKNPVRFSYAYREMNLVNYTASICDKNGDLLFYTNGCSINNYLDTEVENGDTLSPGNVFDNYCGKKAWGYPLIQSALILPSNSDSIYYIFNKSAEIFNFDPIVRINKILCTVVDMSKNNGKGKVIKKHKLALSDTLIIWDFTATKHANGKDWWITSPQYFNGKYTTLLFDGEDIIDTVEQKTPLVDITDGCSAVFSPDGKKYARFDPQASDQLFLMDFDRKTGLRSNFKHITVSDYFTTAGCGVAFSPNSRFLYVTLAKYVYQFDTEAADVAASKVMVAEYDGFKEFSLATTLHAMQLGPDCKIYINTSNGTKYYHYIDKPDLQGVACKVVQHGIKLPTNHGISIPHFPNYRLGTLENPGYPCDSTLHLTATGLSAYFVPSISVYPNPSAGSFHLTLPEGWLGKKLQVINLAGQVMFEQGLSNSSQDYFIETNLNSGMYFVNILFENHEFFTEKVVFQE